VADSGDTADTAEPEAPEDCATVAGSGCRELREDLEPQDCAEEQQTGEGGQVQDGRVEGGGCQLLPMPSLLPILLILFAFLRRGR